MALIQIRVVINSESPKLFNTTSSTNSIFIFLFWYSAYPQLLCSMRLINRPRVIYNMLYYMAASEMYWSSKVHLTDKNCIYICLPIK